MRAMRFVFLAWAVFLILAIAACSGCATMERVKERGLFVQEVTQGISIQPDGSVVSVPLTNTVVNQAVVDLLKGAQQVNGMVNPTPSAPFVNLGINLTLGALAAIAAMRSRRNKQVTDLMAQAIEDDEASTVKEKVAELSLKRGIADVVHKRVQSVVKKK